MSKLRTLVIDDSAEIREFVTEYILKPQGFDVETAADGLDGVGKALNNPPDLILTDFEMPKMNGLELLRELRKHHQNIPVILMTSHGSEQIAVEFFRLGIYDYLIKPFNTRDMLEAIEKALFVTRLQRDKESLTQRLVETNRILKRSLDELNALYEVGKSITALMPANQLLERIVDSALLITQSQECALVLVDTKTGEIKGSLRKRTTHHAFRRQMLPATQELTPLAITRQTGGHLKESVRSIPLQVGQRIFGTLSISKPFDETFTENDERLLQMLADYSAIAVHNMQLFHQLQLTKEREKQQIRSVFERYVAPSVVEQLLAQPEKVSLGGTRQTVTVLFADVRGFSTFSSQISPEILIDLLNQYMHVAANAILTQEGTLDKFMGDAIMAFFNAPLPQPDHPIRAVRAAWNLCQAVKYLYQRLPTPYHLNFGVGVGIGDVVVGNVGTAKMMNYTVIGDSVNKVKRLQEKAQGGQILISQVTYHLVQEYIEAQPIGEISLKGQPHPEIVYEVLNVT
jgi:class 3 adenylate cyclase/CheY-like chemotaxis protein